MTRTKEQPPAEEIEQTYRKSITEIEDYPIKLGFDPEHKYLVAVFVEEDDGQDGTKNRYFEIRQKKFQYYSRQNSRKWKTKELFRKQGDPQRWFLMSKTKRLEEMQKCRKDGNDWPYTNHMARKRKAERRKIKKAAEVCMVSPKL